MIHVVVTAPFPGKLLDKIERISTEIKLEQISLPDGRWPEDKKSEADVIYAHRAVPRPSQAPRLNWVQVHWAGVDHLTHTALWNSDIALTTASGIHAPNIGQYVMAQILAWANKIPDWLRHQAKSEWPSDRWQRFLPDELRDKTLGLLGYGSLGREIARLAKGFGMHVLATKRDAKTLKHRGYTIPGTGDPDGTLADRIYPGEATRSMVSECDYLVITLPLTDKTHHLIHADVLREMKPSCFLINVGRGKIIHETDLTRALKKGWIAGAGLDVFETEPLPPDSPLWSMKNVIISPHVSGFTPYYDERVTDLFAENLRRYVSGEQLLNLVNRDNGY